MMNRQTNGQTNKNFTFLVAPAADEIRGATTFGMVIEDLEHILVPGKIFLV